MARRSKYFKVNGRDFIHGMLLAIASAIVAFCTQAFTIDANSIIPHMDLNAISIPNIGKVALITALVYIGKQFTSNSDGSLWKKEINKPDTDNPGK